MGIFDLIGTCVRVFGLLSTMYVLWALVDDIIGYLEGQEREHDRLVRDAGDLVARVEGPRVPRRARIRKQRDNKTGETNEG